MNDTTTITEQQLKNVIQDFVRLSEETVCGNCGRQSKLIGETREFGNWVCPYCLTYFPYKDNPKILVEIPFIKLTTQLDNAQPKSLQQPLGVAPVDFPMDLSTGFLVPSYSSSAYRIKRKRNVLLGQAIDFTRFGRIKSGLVWGFVLGYNDRTQDEYETLASFAETMGNHNPFNYTDPFRQSSHVCFFESDISDAEPASFDGVSFSIEISE
jgi:hypothetical protein